MLSKKIEAMKMKKKSPKLCKHLDHKLITIDTSEFAIKRDPNYEG